MVQKHWSNGDYNLYDAANFAEIWTAMGEKQVIGCPISIGDTPCSDKAIKENNKILTSLHSPFYGKFYGGAADDDGKLYWDVPIEIASFIHGDGPDNVLLSPRRSGAPLEVGTTESHVTFWHLMHERILARWPYGSKIVWLLVTVDDRLWGLDSREL